MNARAAELITRAPAGSAHPEGGYYREIFRSADLVEPADGRGPRAALTTIYFLLPAGINSRWHRVTSDEVWHLYEGGPLEVLTVDPGFSVLSRHELKPRAPVCTVAAGALAGRAHARRLRARGLHRGSGFDFEDFTILGNDAASTLRLLALDQELASLI